MKSHVGLDICFFCQEAKGVVLSRRLRDEIEAKAVYNMEPCDTCKGYMEQGVILIQTRDGETGSDPYRMGGWVVVKEEAMIRLVGADHPSLKARVAFIDETTWNAVGLGAKS